MEKYQWVCITIYAVVAVGGFWVAMALHEGSDIEFTFSMDQATRDTLIENNYCVFGTSGFGTDTQDIGFIGDCGYMKDFLVNMTIK